MEKGRVDPSFWRKAVYILDCGDCGEQVCKRGMRLLWLQADTPKKFFTTDAPDSSKIGVIPQILKSSQCECKLQKFACLSCGGIVGYHVLKRCLKCICEFSNGHFWLLHSNCISRGTRNNPHGESYMTWKDLPAIEEDEGVFTTLECLR